MDKIKITYIISNIDKALAFEWIANYFDKNKFELQFILLNSGSSELQRFLQQNRIKIYFINYRGKKDIPATFFIIWRILKKEKPAIIHTHLFDASLIGLLAGKLAGITKRILTRHHGNQHHVYFPNAVYYDKFINSIATHIIAPSESVKNILTNLEGVKSEKVKVINHGFDLSYFSQVDSKSVESLQQKYNPNNKWPVIGVISRYLELKGIQYIIPAFKRALELYPNALLLLANANGSYKAQVQHLLAQLDSESYIEIPFEAEVSTLYKLFDLFIHVPIEQSSEAFGQIYIEALASGIPSVFTLSGVASEFIEHRKNAYIVSHKNSEEIYEAIIEVLGDASLRSSIIRKGKVDVFARFTLKEMINKLEKIYEV
ncbi:glycosyltransferase family 4 protein [Adhaeribacter radiodurans]|uniref:Glycosyltransferase family 4 protein n=1 Tax=Adhaeribacter radiodurans TaxID=2745197 RepID=A0A7L7L464_9BACT|nr:glycosyltransferase family 4 protein [Adhaeribacter radiodurans]QMU27570.1 glycosyltransferase family 4 protein [Adhaeribacter radiodurans]